MSDKHELPESFQLEVESQYGEWQAPTPTGERMSQVRLMQIFEVQTDPLLSSGTENLFVFLLRSAKDAEQKELIVSVFRYVSHLRAEQRELANEVMLANDWTTPYEEREQKRQLKESAPELLQANEAAIQCISDFLECYKNDCALVVMDEAVKSLKNDALPLLRATGARARGETL